MYLHHLLIWSSDWHIHQGHHCTGLTHTKFCYSGVLILPFLHFISLSATLSQINTILNKYIIGNTLKWNYSLSLRKVQSSKNLKCKTTWQQSFGIWDSFGIDFYYSIVNYFCQHLSDTSLRLNLNLSLTIDFLIKQITQRILVKKDWVPVLHRPKQCFVFIWNESCSLHHTSSPVNAANDILILNISKSSS